MARGGPSKAVGPVHGVFCAEEGGWPRLWRIRPDWRPEWILEKHAGCCFAGGPFRSAGLPLGSRAGALRERSHRGLPLSAKSPLRPAPATRRTATSRAGGAHRQPLSAQLPSSVVIMSGSLTSLISCSPMTSSLLHAPTIAMTRLPARFKGGCSGISQPPYRLHRP